MGESRFPATGRPAIPTTTGCMSYRRPTLTDSSRVRRLSRTPTSENRPIECRAACRIVSSVSDVN